MSAKRTGEGPAQSMSTRRGILQGALLAAVAMATRRAAAQDGETQAPPTGTMPRRALGSTGIEVSIVGLGGAHIGRQRDEQESIRIVREAIDHGVTFLDNSWDYNGGRSEERMGKALTEGYRQRAFLMTKLDGRTARAANAQLEQSLRRLGTDAIDLVQIHEVIRPTDPARVFARGGAIEALVAARQAGKLRFIGFTGHKSPQIHNAMLDAAEAHGFTFDTVQMPLNVMDPHYDSFQLKVLPRLVEHKIGVIGMKSMGDRIILDSGVVSAEDCLRYSMSLPTSVVVTGCDSLPILYQALRVAYGFTRMSDEERNALLTRTAHAGGTGQYERFKTSGVFDSTAKNPRWLDTAKI